jgi:hypothetical protein
MLFGAPIDLGATALDDESDFHGANSTIGSRQTGENRSTLTTQIRAYSDPSKIVYVEHFLA